MKHQHGHILTGTSGWTYDHWKGPFYAEDLRDSDRLAYYAEHFHSVEINNSFYHLPEKKTLEHWRDTVAEDFVFTAKASRYITHMKKLKDPEDSIKNFFERIGALREKLGPVLFQLPPNWKFNAQRLQAFLDTLSRDFRYAFEFRDHSWHNEQTCELLARHDAAFCMYELDGFVSPRHTTTDFVYIRLHGPGGPYQGSYDANTLSGWSGAFSSWASSGHDVYCYFDNDEAGYAAQNALRLQSMLPDASGG